MQTFYSLFIKLFRLLSKHLVCENLYLNILFSVSESKRDLLVGMNKKSFSSVKFIIQDKYKIMIKMHEPPKKKKK